MRWKLNQPDQWYKWFAWHPVKVHGEVVWLETIEPKKCVGQLANWYTYRDLLTKE